MTKDLEYYLNLPWTYNFEWSDEDNCYIASVKELKGCMADGETIQEASEMIKSALISHLSACIEAEFEIPEPVKITDCKGKISYRTTPQKHCKLLRHAKALGISINAFIDSAIDMKLAQFAQ